MPEHHDWFQGSAVAPLTLVGPHQNHTETGETGGQFLPGPASSAQTGGVVFDRDERWYSHLHNYVASHSSGSSNTVFAPSSYTRL